MSGANLQVFPISGRAFGPGIAAYGFGSAISIDSSAISSKTVGKTTVENGRSVE